MGGANIGPEFTAEEYLVLADLCVKEEDLSHSRRSIQPSNFMAALEQAVFESGRWQKWLHPDEYPQGDQGQKTEGWGKGSLSVDPRQVWNGLSPERRSWLTQTGARYVWTAPSVVAARQSLYTNLAPIIPDPHQKVVERIAGCMEKYVVAFHLFDSLSLLETG